MRIAILSDCYLPAINGVVTSISQQLSILRARGHEVDVYCPSYPQAGSDEVGVHRFWARPFPFHKREQFALAWPPRTLMKLWTGKYDLLHLQTPFSIGLIGLVVAKLRGIPCLFHHHTLWEEYVDYLPLPAALTSKISVLYCRIFANLCGGVISPSEEVRSRFKAQGVQRPISVIPTGIQASDFQGGRVRPEWKEGHEVCLYIGRLAHEKSIDVVLEVFVRLHAQRPSTRLWVVGDGPAREALERQASELGLGEVCRFFGFVERRSLRDFLASARLFLFASLTETQGLVILEAQAAGVPVVARRASGVNEAVEVGQTGYLLDPGDEEAMVQSSLKLLSDERLYREFSDNAVEWAECFSVERMGEALEQVYSELVKEPRSR